ncbi:MAG: CoA transferase [Burkholderiaceae bacterium]|jgi:alpha-methylacyl-CoA racemase|nr:CoA transferase [Burkholderiaceae bacterium]
MTGPLSGVKVVEIAALGPAPFCAMVLADLGATVLRIARPGHADAPGSHQAVLNRGRETLTLNLKSAADRDAALTAIAHADALIEGFRPGVMERLGLGPQDCMARNPRLVYGRITGWGQHGPLAQTAGHDINYIALSGALGAMVSESSQLVPLNLVGDFGGGAMLLAVGVLSALLEARSSGKGQVVDAAMTDGSALLMAMVYGLRASGEWPGAPGHNTLDGGAPFYGTYLCADGRRIAIGAIEPAFYAQLLSIAGIDDPDFNEPWDRERWPRLKNKLAAVFISRSRDEWSRLFEGTDACVTPVLDMDEAPTHRHNVARGTFIDIDRVVQPAPAPRFSRTAPRVHAAGPQTLAHTLASFGLEARAAHVTP